MAVFAASILESIFPHLAPETKDEASKWAREQPEDTTEQIDSTVNPASCERTVTFQDGKVVDQSWTGDPAYCRYFKRS